MTYKEKLNKILNLHRSKEALNILESKKELDMVMYALWIDWEIKNLNRLKYSKERESIKNSMIDLVDILYYKYNALCLR